MQGLSKEQSAGYLANHMARLFTRMMNSALEPLGLSTASLGILLELWREEGLTQNDLVERLDHEQATIANTLKRMERDGLIVRRTRPTDRRSRSIHLTARARSLQSEVTALACSINAHALRVLTPAEQEVFTAMIRRVIAGQQEFLQLREAAAEGRANP